MAKQPNIETIHPVRVKFKEGRRNVYGTAVGAFFRPYWHPYMYSALHIETDDGRQVTIHAKEVTFL